MDNPWAKKEQAKPIAKSDIKLPPYWKILAGNLLFAGMLLFLCSSSIILVFFLGVVVMVVLLPMAITARSGPRELLRQRWTRFAVYAVAFLAAFMLDHQASEREQRSFNEVIAAVEQYKAAEKRYPDTLEQLVPKYLDAVPTGRWGKFLFSVSATDNANVMHMPMPYVHETYDFNTKKRRTWD